MNTQKSVSKVYQFFIGTTLAILSAPLFAQADEPLDEVRA